MEKEAPELVNGQQIKLGGIHAGKTVTVVHAYAELVKNLGTEIAKEFKDQPHVKNQPACAIATPSILTGDYRGKEGDLRKEREAIDRAPLLMHGDIVFIEGEAFRTVISERHVSDPVIFHAI